MTYSLSLTGHGASADDAKHVFEDTVRALRTVNAEGNDPMLSGQISGSGGDGTNFTLNVSEVEDLEDTEAEGETEEVEDE